MGFFDLLSATLGMHEIPEKKPRKIKVDLNSQKSVFGDRLSIFAPVSFADIVNLTKTLRKNEPVIVNFLNIQRDEAERSLDFICGAVCALGGKLERIGEGIYFYAPQGVRVDIDKRYKKGN